MRFAIYLDCYLSYLIFFFCIITLFVLFLHISTVRFFFWFFVCLFVYVHFLFILENWKILVAFCRLTYFCRLYSVYYMFFFMHFLVSVFIGFFPRPSLDRRCVGSHRRPKGGTLCLVHSPPRRSYQSPSGVVRQWAFKMPTPVTPVTPTPFSPPSLSLTPPLPLNLPIFSRLIAVYLNA